MINPLRQVEVNHFTLHHPKVTPALEGYTIAQISDVHMGRWVKPRHMQQLVEYVNAQAPNLVALTGDYVGYNKRDIDRCVEVLDGLAPPSFAVLGNHDHWTDGDRAQRVFADASIDLLTNEHRVLEFGPNGADGILQVVGVDDLVTDHADVARAFSGTNPNAFSLTLNHVPEAAPDCAEHGGDLILSGHTHNFQFNIPRLTNKLATTFGTRFFAGPYKLGDSFLYINRGLGSASWPVRIRAKPELTFIRLAGVDDRSILELERTESISVDH